MIALLLQKISLINCEGHFCHTARNVLIYWINGYQTFTLENLSLDYSGIFCKKLFIFGN